ncbi:MAG TPA: biotin/lipoyl-containing protein, partial [Solirubrobacteraceae bacterium]|nr:biotin/lipoyl-containing protein [Solirubrobacteraceae bacterium]
MPSLGADMTQGKLVNWRVKPGDAVKRGDIVATVDTSKAEIDVEIFQDGTIDEILVHEGERVPVGTVLATVRTEAPAAVPTQPGAAAEPAVPAATPTAPPVAAPARVLASPLARRTAAEVGASLADLHGSGPDGAVLARDV